MRRHTRFPMVAIFAALGLAGPIPAALAQQTPSDYQEVLKYLGRPGDYKDNVLKVNFPRNDVQVSIAGVATPTPFGFGGWVAMTKGTDGHDVMMGDLVLLQEEVNAVMSALLDNGLDVTALHNHFFWEDPRIFFMHIHGHGKAIDLAHEVKPAVDLMGHAAAAATPAKGTASSELKPGPLDTAKIASIVGHAGEQTGPVYKITLGRDDLTVKEMGAAINARMGMNTWAAFYGTNEDAEVAGDVAMRESEVTTVLKALRKNGLNVVAIHHHMTTAQPTVIFLHYWGRGPADKVAAGFRAALDAIEKGLRGSSRAGETFAQKLVDELVARHPELIRVGLHVTPPKTSENLIIASNVSEKIGQRSDPEDLQAMQSGKPVILKEGENFDVTLPLHDAAGEIIGAVGLTFKPQPGEQESDAIRRAKDAAQELEKQILSKAKLFAPAG